MCEPKYYTKVVQLRNKMYVICSQYIKGGYVTKGRLCNITHTIYLLWDVTDYYIAESYTISAMNGCLPHCNGFYMVKLEHAWNYGVNVKYQGKMDEQNVS